MSQSAIYILIGRLKKKLNGRCSQQTEIKYSNLLFQFMAQTEIMGYKPYQKPVAQCVPRSQPMNSNVSVLLAVTALQRHFSLLKSPTSRLRCCSAPLSGLPAFEAWHFSICRAPLRCEAVASKPICGPYRTRLQKAPSFSGRTTASHGGVRGTAK